MTTVLQFDSAAAGEAIAGAEGIVLVDFTAAWCAPCRLLSPVLDQLAHEATDLTVLKVDVDASPDLASNYRVMSMPTLIFLAEGRELRRLVGARSIASLREELEQVRAEAHLEYRT